MNITCKRCGIEKPQTDYYFDNGPQRYKSTCKYCFIGQVLSSRKTNAKRCSVEDCGKVHYALSYCRQHHAQIKRKGEILDHEYFAPKPRKSSLKAYGLTQESYDILSKDGCNVCGSLNSLVIDHDHSCCASGIGKYCGNCTRGVVCFSCNLSIGKYETNIIRADNPLLLSIQDYLSAYEQRKTK